MCRIDLRLKARASLPTALTMLPSAHPNPSPSLARPWDSGDGWLRRSCFHLALQRPMRIIAVGVADPHDFAQCSPRSTAQRVRLSANRQTIIVLSRRVVATPFERSKKGKAEVGHGCVGGSLLSYRHASSLYEVLSASERLRICSFGIVPHAETFASSNWRSEAESSANSGSSKYVSALIASEG